MTHVIPTCNTKPYPALILPSLSVVRLPYKPASALLPSAVKLGFQCARERPTFCRGVLGTMGEKGAGGVAVTARKSAAIELIEVRAKPVNSEK